MRSLFSPGVQTNVRDPEGNCLLHLAVEKKNLSLVVLLLTMTPNPLPELAARNNQGKTVMEIARGNAGKSYVNDSIVIQMIYRKIKKDDTSRPMESYRN